MTALGLGLYLGRYGPTGGASTPAQFDSIAADGIFATYGADLSGEFTPEASPEAFTVTRSGFTGAGAATTFDENLVVTKRKREWNSQTLTAREASVQDVIYSADVVDGATNNSTVVSPKPIARWAYPDHQLIGDTLDAQFLEVVAFHRDGRDGKPVASVKWTISDGTTDITVTSSAPVVSGLSTDLHAVTVYRPASDVDVSSLDDSATITVSASVYPRIGVAASVRSTADFSSWYEFSPRKFRRDTTRAAAPFYIYIDAATGTLSPAISTTAATAKASPCSSIGRALKAWEDANNAPIEGLVLRLMDGDQEWGGMSGNWGVEAGASNIVIENDPAATTAKLVYSTGASFLLGVDATVDFVGIEFRGITLSHEGGGGIDRVGSGSGSNDEFNLWFNDCQWDMAANGTGVTSDAQVRISTTGLTTSTTDNTVSTLRSGPVNGTPRYPLLRGFSGVSSPVDYTCVLGSDIEGTSDGGIVAGRTVSNNMIVAFSEFRNVLVTGQTVEPVSAGQGSDVDGFAIVGCLFESWDFVGTAVWRISGDSASGNNNHVLLWHNTLTGFNSASRCNIFYNEGATARNSTLASGIGLILSQFNIKGDEFENDATRTGHAHVEYGAGWRGQWIQFRDAGGTGDGISASYTQTYPGLATTRSVSDTVRLDPGFTDYQGPPAAATDGAGGGDYRLTVGAAAENTVKNSPLPFDIDGTARSAAGTNPGPYA